MPCSSGKQIKPDSLGAKQIKGSTLTDVTASAIGTVHYATITVPVSGSPAGGNQGTAVCPVGTYVIGGGASVNDETFGYVNDSAPSPTHTGWTATAYGEPGTTMTVSAICTEVRAIGTTQAVGVNPPVGRASLPGQVSSAMRLKSWSKSIGLVM